MSKELTSLIIILRFLFLGATGYCLAADLTGSKQPCYNTSVLLAFEKQLKEALREYGFTSRMTDSIVLEGNLQVGRTEKLLNVNSAFSQKYLCLSKRKLISTDYYLNTCWIKLETCS